MVELWELWGNFGWHGVGERERDLFYETEPKHDVQKKHRDTPLLSPKKHQDKKAVLQMSLGAIGCFQPIG